MSRERIADQFRRLFEADAAKGRVRSLESYQRVFRGFEDVVAGEYARLAASPAGGPVAPQTPAPPEVTAAAGARGAGTPAADDAAKGAANGAAPSPAGDAITRLRGRSAAEYGTLGEVARGGMGAILRVRDDVLQRDLAMKVILDRGAGQSDELRERFVAEARITARLDHPGVVPIHELGLDGDGRLYFTMKLVSGRTLGDVLRLVRENAPGWTPTRVAGIVARFCETLAFAHSRGVVHRDVKPANVMVGDFGEVYLMDWGLAKTTGEHEPKEAPPSGGVPAPGPAGGTNLTMAGSILGTPGYMAPEQVSDVHGKVDARSDVFAVGAILYELLAGAPPYAGPDGRVDARTAVMALHVGPPRPLEELATAAPDELVAIVEKAMARAPADRYPDAAALATDLRDYLDGRVVRAHRTGPVVELVKWVRRNRALASAVGAAAVLLVAGLATNLALLAKSREDEAKARRQAYRANLAGAAMALGDHDPSTARSRLDAAIEGREPTWEYLTLASRVVETSELLDAAAVRFLADGRRRIVRTDWTLAERDAAGAERTTFDARPARVVRVSRDGAVVVLDAAPRARWGRREYTLNRTADGSRILDLDVSDAATGNAQLHPDRPWIIRITSDQRLCVFDYDAGRELASIADTSSWGIGQPAVVNGDREHPDGVFTLHRPDLSLEIRDARTLALVTVFRGHTEGCIARICRITGRVYSASTDDTIRAWDRRTPDAPVWTVSGNRVLDPVAIAVSPDGRTVGAAPTDGSLCLLDAATGAEKVILHGPSRGSGRGFGLDEDDMEFSPDGLLVSTPQGDRRSAVWSVAVDGDLRVLHGHCSFVYDVEFSPDGTLLASAGWDGFAGKPGAVRIWDAATGAPVAALGAASEFAFDVCWSADGRTLYAETRELDQTSTACRFDVTTGAEIADLSGLASQVALAPSKTRAATLVLPEDAVPGAAASSVARRVRTVDVATGRTLAEGPVLQPAQMAMSFPTERLIAADVAGATGAIRIFDADTLETRFDLVGHTAPPWFTTANADGSLLVTGAADGTARIWDAATGAPLHVLGGHGVVAYCAAFSPDAKRLAVGGYDGQVHIWDTATWEELTSLRGHTNYVKSVAWSADGTRLVSGSGDGTLRVWSDASLADVAAALAARRRIVEAWTPRVAAALGDASGDALTAAAAALATTIRNDASLPPRERDVALQVVLAETVARRDRR